MRYEGLSAHTRPLRWGLFLVTVGLVLVATGPQAVQAVTNWLGAHSDSLAWYSSRVLGFMAYGALAISVVYGLLLSTGILDRIAHRAVSLTLHQDLSAIAIGLTALHGALLALDTFVPQTVRQLTIPFASPYRPEWTGLGQIAFYVMVMVFGSFYVRRHIGQRAWRLLHYTTFLAFVGATVHGVMAGTDSPADWAFWIYSGATVTVVSLIAYRIAAAATDSARSTRKELV